MRCIVAIDGEVVNAGAIEFTPVRTTAVAAGAVQISQAFEVSLDGRLLRGAPGDYLVIGEGGELYPLPCALFNALYQRKKELSV